MSVMNKNFLYITIFFLLALPILGYVAFIAPPFSNPTKNLITVESGASVRSVANELQSLQIIRSTFVFSSLITLFGNHGVIAGTYSVPTSENVVALAKRFASGDTRIQTIKVTIPEGSTSKEIALILSKKLSDFDSEKFISLSAPLEGKLFPDSYFFEIDVTPEEIVKTMTATYEKRIDALRSQMESFGKTEHEVLVMASILEREGRQSETRRMIADILWKRIARKMPLQVDAVFGYILGKSGYAPTLDDLKIDSPYNTYLNRDLPPTPIGNPGLSAIEDAMTPTKNPYFYYLTDSEGRIYYATTFAEHVANKNKARLR
ncbi:endolytic transglycosylase MltG [Patescibacteria group bacterium]|nr:MAG: endolytic transglycosylase MltG [Patescibacteria group bacterium]